MWQISENGNQIESFKIGRLKVNTPLCTETKTIFNLFINQKKLVSHSNIKTLTKINK